MSSLARPWKSPLPAPSTKHIDELYHPIPGRDGLMLRIRQSSSSASSNVDGSAPVSVTKPQAASSRNDGSTSTGTTGTTLWLGAQVMAAYLYTTLPREIMPLPSSSSSSSSSTSQSLKKRRRALELGSGVGYLSLCLAQWEWDVIATDIPPALETVLRPNVEDGLERITHDWAKKGKTEARGDVRVRSLDWVESPSLPNQRQNSAQHNLGTDTDDNVLECMRELVSDGLDMIVTTDTLYHPTTIIPLWNTIYHLCMLSAEANATRSRMRKVTEPTLPPAPSIGPEKDQGKVDKSDVYPTIYIALEKRDPVLIDKALAEGEEYGLSFRKVPLTKLSKALGVGGAEWGWKREDWEGVEVWKVKLT